MINDIRSVYCAIAENEYYENYKFEIQYFKIHCLILFSLFGKIKIFIIFLRNR